MAGLASTSLRLAVAVWLLATNLSLGQYHRHDATDAPMPGHRAAPDAWHYHVLLLGVELEFLSLNADSCPFTPVNSTDRESHVLLANLVDPGTQDETTPVFALLLACLAVIPWAPDAIALDVATPSTAVGCDGVMYRYLSPSTAGARSGVQQV